MHVVFGRTFYFRHTFCHVPPWHVTRCRHPLATLIQSQFEVCPLIFKNEIQWVSPDFQLLIFTISYKERKLEPFANYHSSPKNGLIFIVVKYLLLHIFLCKFFHLNWNTIVSNINKTSFGNYSNFSLDKLIMVRLSRGAKFPHFLSLNKNNGVSLTFPGFIKYMAFSPIPDW